MTRAFQGLAILLFTAIAAQGQNREQWLMDWKNEALSDSLRFDAVYNLAWEYVYEQTDSAIAYANLALNMGEQKKNNSFISKAYNVRGSAHLVKHQLDLAKSDFWRARDIAEAIHDQSTLASVYNNLGGLYYNENNYPEAQHNYNLSYEIQIRSGNLIGQASALNNLGMISEAQGDLQMALSRYKQSLETKKRTGAPTGLAYVNMGNIYQQMNQLDEAERLYRIAIDTLAAAADFWNLSDVYTDLAALNEMQHDRRSALENYDRCIELSRKLGNESSISFALHQKGGIYIDQHQLPQAKSSCLEALRIAQKINDLQNSANACECLHEAYRGAGDYRSALHYHEQFVAMSDSLKKLKNLDEVAKLSIRHDFQLRALEDSLVREEEKIKTAYAHQHELNRKQNERNLFIAVAITILLLAVVLANRLWFSNKAKKMIQYERERSENLLLNILPASVAEELKLKGKSEARLFPDVTVLFTDFCDFTSLSEKLTAVELIAEVDNCFREFDSIIKKHGLEKIKTIGDSYMAVAGMPSGNQATTADAIRAAIEIMSFVEQRYQLKKSQQEPCFQMRAGLHSGDVIAGVVGHDKIQYDIWGDTVNTASRIESSGEAGKINISEDTYKRVSSESKFRFISRGKVAAKNKGELLMYFVEPA